jgi:hypothetical protein
VCLFKLFLLRNEDSCAAVYVQYNSVALSTSLAHRTAYMPHMHRATLYAQNPEHVEDFTERVVGVLKDR